ncbi:MAG: glycosyltransferase [Mycobacteriaceae bacterium]
MQEVHFVPLDAARLRGLFLPDRAERFTTLAAEARELTRGRVVWNVNATAQGGGVAEMLHTLLGYVRGVGVDTRWLVLTGSPEFFIVTKRLHNLLHGDPGDGGPMGAAEHAVVADALAPDLDEMVGRVSAGDVVVLHDPQTAGMVDRLRAAGAVVVWRCHVGRDDTNELTRRAWSFLRPLVQHADAFVFSRDGYAPEWCGTAGLRVISPSIDPFSAKNCALTDEEVRDSLRRSGLVTDGGDGSAVGFLRGDGSRGSVRRHDGLVVDGPPIPAGARLVVQVSRWDRLKDMAGVQQGFVDTLGTLPDDVHLVLVGPDVSGVADDPEGAAVLAECRALWSRLGARERRRVHLVCLPMDDEEENAHLVNALQRRSTVMVQKSLVEGFGLTVTEAMWKGRPLLASAVGGIQDQVTDGQDGLLLRDPTDLAGFGAALTTLLNDFALASRLGRAAHHRVHEEFLGDKHLGAYVELLRWLSSWSGRLGSATAAGSPAAR